MPRPTPEVQSSPDAQRRAKVRRGGCLSVLWLVVLVAGVPLGLAQAVPAAPTAPAACVDQPHDANSGDRDPPECTDTSNPEGLPPWVEYRKQVEPSQRIGPLEQGFAGERVSLYNGATTFSVTDIDIPGNSALPVRLVRRLSVEIQPQGQVWLEPYDTRLQGAGNWGVDVPYIGRGVKSCNATSSGSQDAVANRSAKRGQVLQSNICSLSADQGRLDGNRSRK